MDVSAAEVYLLDRWNRSDGPADVRRAKIFQDFVSLGVRGRWEWHRKANGFIYTAEEEEILRSCRTDHERTIWDWIGQDVHRLLFEREAFQLSDDELEAATGFSAELCLACLGERYHGKDVFDFMPEVVYSMTAFDHPDDIAEAQLERDQQNWVTGVYCIVDESLTLIWCDEYGQTIRRKVVDVGELRELDETFEQLQHFESKWWLEAECIGRYASDKWWENATAVTS